MKKISRFLTLTLLAVGLMVLSACGGGGSSGSSSSPVGNTLSGTAATGAPIVAGTVTLKDSAGVTDITFTDAKGNYSFDVNGKHFPLMLKVQPNTEGAAPLFSAALAWGTANSTPLTTLQVFEATGRTDPSPIYNSGDFSKIGKSSLDYGKSTVTSNFATQFAANGLDLTTHDPITTPMLANGVGMDAILDQTNVAIIGNKVNLTDSQGRCTPYGGGLTLGIDGMAPEYLPSFFGLPPLLDWGTDLLAGYMQKALDSVCIAGTPVPDGSAVTDGHSESYYRVIWTGDPTTYTRQAVDALKTSLRLAANKQRLPINVVAHSWGTIIAYIALTELAVETPSVKIENLITMGSPVQYLAAPNTEVFTVLAVSTIQAPVPTEFRGQPIRMPGNLTSWTNYWSQGDIISTEIAALHNNSQILTNISLSDVCTTPTTLLTILQILPCHKAYFQSIGTPGSVLSQISSILFTSQASASIVPITTPAPVSTAPATLPSAFNLSVDIPYCDLSTPPGPAVKLTWSASVGAVNYRVFRNDSAIGVNLIASQLSFQNNLGLVAGQTYNYKVQAMNVNGATWSSTVPVTIPISVCPVNPAPSSLSFTTTSLPSATIGTGYAQGVAVSGGQTPYTWSVSSGLPPGLAINSTWGSIYGTPTTVGTFSFTVTATDSSSPQKTASQTLSLTVTGTTTTPTLSITTTSLNPASATVNTGYAAQQAITAIGGQTPYSWSASGLPNGMAINSSTGAIFGTPTVAGTFNFTITVTDSSSPQMTASKVLSITVSDLVSAPTTPTLSWISPSTITQGTSYQNVTFTGNFTASSWQQYSVSGGSSWAWAGSAPIYNGPTSLTVAVNDTVAQTIYWRVCASYGSTSCSGSQTVTVQPLAVSIPIASYVTPSTLTQGTGFQNVVITGGNFTSTSYHQLSNNGGAWYWASSAPIINNSTSMTVALALANAQTTFIRVCSAYGNTSSCSGSVSVVIQAAAVSIPATPTGAIPGTLSGPGPVTLTSTVNMSWNTVSGALDYTLIVIDVTNNTQPLNIRLPGNTYTMSLTAGHQYRWHLTACNTAGCSGSTALYYQTPGAGPTISYVSPNPAVATGAAQPFTIFGSNFATGTTVTLRTSGGAVYANRTISSLSATQIVINPNFGTVADTWTVEVISASGVSSGQFTFTVRL
jgi:hypothetical protein